MQPEDDFNMVCFQIAFGFSECFAGAADPMISGSEVFGFRGVRRADTVCTEITKMDRVSFL